MWITWNSSCILICNQINKFQMNFVLIPISVVKRNFFTFINNLMTWFREFVISRTPFRIGIPVITHSLKIALCGQPFFDTYLSKWHASEYISHELSRISVDNAHTYFHLGSFFFTALFVDVWYLSKQHHVIYLCPVSSDADGILSYWTMRT